MKRRIIAIYRTENAKWVRFHRSLLNVGSVTQALISGGKIQYLRQKDRKSPIFGLFCFEILCVPMSRFVSV